MEAVIVIVVILMLTLPSYLKYEKKHKAKWEDVKSDWDNQSSDDKLWYVAENIKAIMFGVLILVIIAGVILELLGGASK